jgi:hypothetical protein
MPRNYHSIDIDASCQAVFDAVHDYDRRLEWDSMLSQARLLAGATAANVGVRSLCVGTWKGGFLALETEYVRFDRGRVAAVKLTNRPMFFDGFGATIKHDAIGEARSRTTYIYSFRARPRWLAPLLEPIMRIMLAREVRRRLRHLRAFVERNAGGCTTAA